MRLDNPNNMEKLAGLMGWPVEYAPDFAGYLKFYGVNNTDTLTDAELVMAIEHWRLTGTDFRTGAEPWEADKWWEPGLEREQLAEELALEDYVLQAMETGKPPVALGRLANALVKRELITERVALNEVEVYELLNTMLNQVWFKLRAI